MLKLLQSGIVIPIVCVCVHMLITVTYVIRLGEAKARGFARQSNDFDRPDVEPVFVLDEATEALKSSDDVFRSRFISPFLEDLRFRTSADLAEVIKYLVASFPSDQGAGSEKAEYLVYCKLQELYYADSEKRHLAQHTE